MCCECVSVVGERDKKKKTIKYPLYLSSACFPIKINIRKILCSHI